MSVIHNTVRSNGEGRILDLIAFAVRSSDDAQKALQEAGAACLYHLVCHGQSKYLDKLYNDLRHTAPAAAQGMRLNFIVTIHERFAVRIANPENPLADGKMVPFLKMTKSVDSAGKDTFKFELISVKNNTKLTAAEIDAIKAAKLAIKQAGENALNIEWRSKEKETSDAKLALTKDKAINRLYVVLKTIGSQAKTTGFTARQIADIAMTAGMSNDQTKELLDFYNPGDKIVAEDDAFDPLPEDFYKSEPSPEIKKSIEHDPNEKPKKGRAPQHEGVHA